MKARASNTINFDPVEILHTWLSTTMKVDAVVFDVGAGVAVSCLLPFCNFCQGHCLVDKKNKVWVEEDKGVKL